MKVAIAGFGIEGKINYGYWRDQEHEVTIVDEGDISPFDLPYGASSIVGKNAFSSLQDFDLVIRTASLAPSRIKTKGRIWSATNEFFDKCPAPIVGVTGTKGKGTTSSLVASILRAAGKTVHLVGNIGVPALSELSKIHRDDIVVYELSSFQLWDLEKSPHIAVVLMIEPDHLEVHKDMKDYVEAKAHIRKYQDFNDVCFYHPTNEYSAKVAHTADWQGLKPTKQHEVVWRGMAMRYGVPDDGQVYVKDGSFYIRDKKLFEVSSLQLVGAHNVENACAALSAALMLTDDTAALEQGLSEFTGLPHRLKFVREVKGVPYYDDSIATTPGSAMAAIEAFPQSKVLILGGSDKGADYGELIGKCKDSATQVIAIGAIGKKIADLCRKHGVQVEENDTKDMESIVRMAQRSATPGSVVILSPAAASFDMFQSYSDRGEQFVAAVERLS